jgi:hypothetical protein
MTFHRQHWSGLTKRLSRIAAFGALIAANPGVSLAQTVPICDALTLYGNARADGTCRSLSTNNLWVCELTTADMDVHSTFNATTNFHITVRQGSNCEGLAYLAGTWPANQGVGLAFSNAQQPRTICSVNVQGYIDRFNGTTRTPAGGTTFCQAAFVKAQNAGKISNQQATFYIGLCTNNQCP